ncbi:ArnT family glycosyltransferase [Ancylobacter mangrovi]|uniref:ArnT family glycosyltransferase n=1 Tax=Ancylobacter mangrovi TaxID=2972472 RepID=UPI0021630119|nr:glycosyltransferase family 39 protein [Ancylobacter mangrovi]MCS0501344.1 glycosyltransferase family 39 protein [Ancylobacter mangrovi]
MSEAAQLGARESGPRADEARARGRAPSAICVDEEAHVWRARLLLVLFFLACVLPGFFTLPVIDRDEARFAQATRQMVESGDFITPRLGDEPRYKKPIGIYWLQAAAVEMTGMGAQAPIWAYRIPSLLAACLAVLLTHAVGLRLFGARAAFWGAILLAACIVLGGESRLAKTDATLLACAVAGQFVLARLYLARGERLALSWPLLFWGAMGASILIKGPIAPMLAAFTAIGVSLWDRDWRWLKGLRPLVGVPLMLAIVLPWLIAIAAHSGADFFHEAIGKDLLGKVAAGQESHGAPPGAHLAAFLVIFWPGAALAVSAIPWVWANRAEPAVRFCLAWIVPFWIVFELTATKLPHYTLPAYPAIALLAGAALASGRLDRPSWWMRTLVVMAAVGGIVSGLALAGAFYWFESRVPAEAVVLAILAAAIGAIVIWQAVRASMASAYRVLLAQAIVLYTLGFGVVAPRLDLLWTSPRLAAAIAADVACPDPQVMVAGFSEASLLFDIGTGTQTGGGAQAADFLAGPGCRVAVVDERQRPGFDARLAELGHAARTLDTVKGLNLGNGRLLTLDLLVAPDGAGTKGP